MIVETNCPITVRRFYLPKVTATVDFGLMPIALRREPAGEKSGANHALVPGSNQRRLSQWWPTLGSDRLTRTVLRREEEGDTGAVPEIFRPQFAAVRFDYRANNWKTHSHTIGLG